VIWAVRTEKLTGDTAGYGQVVPLIRPSDPALHMMWHAACGALAAPFSPVFLGQDQIPREYGPHRYLTAGEAHRFMDMRKAVSGGVDTVSIVPQDYETTVGAFQESKRLMYLVQRAGKDTLADVHATFVQHEAHLSGLTDAHLRVAEAAILAGHGDDAIAVLSSFSCGALIAGLKLVRDLTTGLSVRLPGLPMAEPQRPPVGFSQIW
jgi:dipeptidase